MQPTDSSALESPAQEHVTRALNFQRMGLTASAERELDLARQADPAIVSDPRYRSFGAQKAEQKAQDEAWKLPMRVGAGLLLADVLVITLIWGLNIAFGNITISILWDLVHVAVDIGLAVALLRLLETGRRAAIWWAVLGLIAGTIASLSDTNWVGLLLQFCYSGSILMVLLGKKPSGVRTGLGIAIFVLGYLGTLCGIFVFAAAGAVH